MKNNTFMVLDVIKKGNTITYKYEVSGLWNKFINKDEIYFAQYNGEMVGVDDSIAVIPLLTNILPISWVFDLDIEIPCIDKDFLEGLEKVKLGYKNMYPNIQMKGKLQTEKIVKNSNSLEKNAVMFSGGVDAYNTLISHLEEKPYIFTIFGADISVDDKKGYENVNKNSIIESQRHGIEYKNVISNFRKSINYSEIMKELAKICNFEWWHDFQHGIALLGLISPYTQILSLKKVYIASSFTKEQVGNYTCASDPTIDNYVAFGNTKIVHDGYEFSRQQKIQNICRYVKNNNQKINLRVCWQSSGGKNCCKCEKCYRTIMAIIAEKEDPRNYGFELNREKYNKMIRKLPQIVKYNFRYKIIQDRFVENYKIDEIPKELKWIQKIDIKNKKSKFIIFVEKIKRLIKNIINEVMKKLRISKSI